MAADEKKIQSQNVPICWEPAEDIEMKIMTSSALSYSFEVALPWVTARERESELKMKLHLHWEQGG